MSMCDAEKKLLANALLDIWNECFIGAFDDQGPCSRGCYNENLAPEINVTQWHKGSQWFEISRRLAIHIGEDTTTTFHPKFEGFCKPQCYIDEHYFPTMLTIQAPHLLANRSLTWVDWSRGGAHPATYGKADITEDFLKRIREGNNCLYNNQPSTICFFFATKFTPSALVPLLQLAQKYFEY